MCFFSSFTGLVLQYVILFTSFWYLCYSINIYIVVVHNKPHVVLHNRRTYFIQFFVCLLFPLERIITQFSNNSQDKYFDWTVTDYFVCAPTDFNTSYFSGLLPSQLAVGIGTTFLVLTAMFLVKVQVFVVPSIYD